MWVITGILSCILYLIGILLLCFFVAALIWAVIMSIETRPLRKKEPGFEFIFIDDEGDARELSEHEQKYINTKFEFGDGARPYIKNKYETKTPDGRLIGFLSRRQLPPGMPIGPSPSQE